VGVESTLGQTTFTTKIEPGMEATRDWTEIITVTAAADPRAPEKKAEQLLDALKTALESPSEHRLFRWGKLPGLFASRVGVSAAAATLAVREGYLEITRTEAKGKLVVEWVRATPKALVYVHEHDSPKATLRELRELLAATRDGIPGWLDHSRNELAQLQTRFEHRAAEMLAKLEKLSLRVESALRRAEAVSPVIPQGFNRIVPWAVAGLEYLDRRAERVAGACPLPDLFRALNGSAVADLSLGEFQDGLRRLHDARALRLVADPSLHETEFAFVVDRMLVGAAVREFA
jgi:plasmid stabilization system protein ParE